MKVRMSRELYDDIMQPAQSDETSIFGTKPGGIEMETTRETVTVNHDISLRELKGVKQVKDISEHYRWKKQLGAG